MSDFESAKKRSRANHQAWSARERERLADDPAAFRKAVRSGALQNLTIADRDKLLATHGVGDAEPTPPNGRQKRPPPARRPAPLGQAKKPAAARQSWVEGEFAYALGTSLALWMTIVWGGLASLVLWSLLMQGNRP